MLIEFSVENFKCFAEKQTLDMRPDPDITSLDENLIRTGLLDEAGVELVLLPSVAIYGANASGKSSLLEALHSISYVHTSKLILGETFFFNEKETTLFLTQVYSEKNFTNYHYQSIKGFDDGTTVLTVKRIRPIEDKQTYFSDLQNNKLDGFDNLIQIFSDQTNRTEEKKARFYYFAEEILENSKPDERGWFWLKDANHHPLIKALLDPDQKTKLEKLLEKADFNISHVELESKNDGVETVYFLTFKIKGQTKPLPFRNQSEGTKKFLLIMPTIVHVLETGAVLLADELEAHLHPDLCRAIIELFNNPETNPKGSQLIFTTHNQDFMAPNLMRPDQIYFVNKDLATGASEVYRASSDKTIDWTKADARLAYHLDRLGGKPHIEDLSLENEISED
jgi:uncharacterized protein